MLSFTEGSELFGKKCQTGIETLSPLKKKSSLELPPGFLMCRD